jgi:C1A family cysteine protease
MPWSRELEKGMGWNPQRPDHRDIRFQPHAEALAATPVEHSLQAQFAKIPYLDQGQQGSCTGHGVSTTFMFDQVQQGLPVVIPSREFVYYNARVTEGTQTQDSGAQVRDAFAVGINLGVPPDSDFPYNDKVYAVRPPQKAYNDALQQKALQYQATRYGSLRATIASGYPFVFGFTVYENFYNIGSDGVMPMPAGQVVGGHCVVAFAYNSGNKGSTTPVRHFRIRNSWGTSWGYGGDFFMPYEYFDQGLTSDYWVLKRIS